MNSRPTTSLLFIGLLLIFTSVTHAQTVPITDDQKVEEALFQALLKVDEIAMTEKSVDDSQVITSQRASNDSKTAQFTGEVFEEATKILVAKYGMDYLPTANGVVDRWNAEKANATVFPNNTNGRKKRSASLNSLRSKRSSTNCITIDDCKHASHIKTRTITGLCNNKENPTIGNSVSPIRRLLGAVSYSDGLNTIRSKSVKGSALPSPRLISNKLHEEGAGLAQRFSPHTNHLHMQIGQFVAHDLIFMPASVSKSGNSLDCSSCDSATMISPNCAPIPVPKDDKYFKKSCLQLTRAINGQTGFGVRTQIDQNTHFLDLSVVYGSSNSEAAGLRSFSNGKMLTFEGAGYTLPPKDVNNPICQSKEPLSCFKCGDFRNSLHPALIPVHTIFIKEHNRICDKIKGSTLGKSMSDEDTYQLTRKIMIGMWQHIIYTEYLPKIIPDQTLVNFDLKPLKSGVYGKYNPKQDPSLTAEFCAAAFRFGHSQSRSDFPRQSAQNATIGNYDLGNNIFYADQNYNAQLGGIESMLQGLIKTPGMMADRQFSFPIRNQMFEVRGKNGSGVDLVSVNIMRGRDIGVLPYCSYRGIVGLPEVKVWADLSSTYSQESINLLKSVYADPADIDLYSGLVMEEPMAGGQLGPTATFMIAEQFKALKTGDRFFYESQVTGTINFEIAEIAEIRKATLAKIVCENTDIAKNVNKNIFDLNSEIISCSSIPEININAFIR